jgi:hypothetical protein
VVLLSLAAIGAITMLQSHAGAGRDAQLQLAILRATSRSFRARRSRRVRGPVAHLPLPIG